MSNIYIRSLYSPVSAIVLSHYHYNIAFKFTPCIGEDNSGLYQYSKTVFLSTTLNYESAAFFYLIAMRILDGRQEEVSAVHQGKNNTTLTFEYKPDPNNQMTAWLTIKKNNETIPFQFTTHQYQTKENGRIVTKTVQTGLGVLAITLNAYLKEIGADLHFAKLSEEELDDHQWNAVYI